MNPQEDKQKKPTTEKHRAEKQRKPKTERKFESNREKKRDYFQRNDHLIADLSMENGNPEDRRPSSVYREKVTSNL